MYNRIIAHTDFDGTISAFLLRDIFNVDEILFTEPWIIQSGDYDIEPGDIIVDLPYDPRCALWIDHHDTSKQYLELAGKKAIFDATKKSCPSLIYEHFHKEHNFLDEPEIIELIEAADKIDSASFTLEDLNNPDSYGKISMSLRTDNKKKDDQYRQYLINILSFMPVHNILKQPMVAKRIKKKEEEHKLWDQAINNYVSIKDHVVITDFSECNEDIGNAPPFMIFAKYPKIPIGIKIDTVKYDDTIYKLTVGKNIFMRDDMMLAKLDIGEIMKFLGGGGHKDVGGCSFPRVKKDEIINLIINKLKL